jgi:drug/metabolite transporter (DMT)-like permease
MTLGQAVITLLVVCGIAAGQVLFKLTAGATTSGAGLGEFVRGLIVNPYFIPAIVLYGGMTAVWILLLQRVALSHAYPFFALTFVLVPILSAVFLSESITRASALGAGFIIAGIVVATAGSAS